MGNGNAIRVTEAETFTLIQLEEERQKLKKKELLKAMLTDSEFSIKGQCAINLMMTKLDIINTFLLMKCKRNFIQMKTGRLKSYDSVCKKMQKKSRKPLDFRPQFRYDTKRKFERGRMWMLKQRLLIGRASGLRSLFGGAISADPSPIVSTGIFH